MTLRGHLPAGAAALLAALPLAAAAAAIHRALPNQPERAVLLVGVLYLSVLVGIVGAYAVRQGGSVSPGRVGFVALATCVSLAAAAYLVWAFAQVSYRADILIWSESPFVNDIIKLRTGAPIYSAPPDLNSFFYTPGSQLLTYGLAKLLGGAVSIPTYRLLQLLYVAIAALLGTRAVRRLRELAGATRGNDMRWELVWVPLLFLCATNALTNPFSHLLHNDALGLLISTLAFLLLLEYAIGRSPRVLLLMAFIPLLGFAVKQSLAIWLGLYVGYLLVFDRPRSLARVAGFGAAAAGILAAGYGIGSWVWGAEFRYWVVSVLGNHPPSPLRAVQHVLDTWVYWAAGLGGGLLLLRSGVTSRMLGLWAVWLLLFVAEAYTSGIAWMLNHMGPGSMIAAIWLAAALPEIWPTDAGSAVPSASWLRAGVATLLALLVLGGLGAVRVPMPGLPADADRYASAIEAEFADGPRERVLLDHGSWPYLEAGISMRDRSAVVGELGATGTGDFSGILGRIRQRYYRRILLRDYATPDFSYEHASWRVPSGIRDSLQAYYQVVRRIARVAGTRNDPIGLREISVLEPLSP